MLPQFIVCCVVQTCSAIADFSVSPFLRRTSSVEVCRGAVSERGGRGKGTFPFLTASLCCLTVSSCTAGGAPSVGGGGGGWFWASGHGRDMLSVTAGARGTRTIADCLRENWESLGQCQTADVLQRRFGDLPGGKLAKPRPVSDCRRTTCPPRLPGERKSLGQCPTADEQRMFGDCLGGNWQSLGQCPTADVYTSYVRGLPGGKLAKPRPVSAFRRKT